MLDCSKAITNQTFGEAYQCFVQPISDALAKITIGEVLTVALTITVMPSLYFAFVLPYRFSRTAYRRYVRKWDLSLDGTEPDTRLRLSGYMVLVGTIVFITGYYEWKNNGDLFISSLGTWILFIGIVVFFLGPSWFAEQIPPITDTESKFEKVATTVFVVALVFATWFVIGLGVTWFHSAVNWPFALLFSAFTTAACLFIGYIQGDKITD